MRFLPIVDRELRVAARRAGTYWLRSLVALVVIVVSAGIFLMNFSASPRDVGQILFYCLTSGGMLYCLFAGLRSTSDCVSEEKREGTLGLLFLTDLKGYDVVLGKLVASSLNTFYGLLAILPVMGIPLLMGGLAGQDVTRVALVLLNTLFFSMSLGIFASCVSRSARKSMAFAICLVLLFAAVAPGLGAFIAYKFHWQSAEEWGLILSPVYTCVAAVSKLIAMRSPNAFYWSLGLIHGLAWVTLALSCFVAPRSWQDRPAGAARLRRREQLRNWSFGDAQQRREFRGRLLDQNAFYWLAARARMKPVWVWLFLGVLAGGWGWGAAKFEREWFNEAIYIMTALVLNSVLKNWVALEAVRQLSEDRRGGSLELLLSTPLTVREILHGQALALLRQFLWPVLAVLLTELVMMIACLRAQSFSSDNSFWICLWLAGMTVLVTDIIALYWVGMWMGLAARNPKRAFSDTVGRILALPWVAWATLMVMIVIFSVRHGDDAGWKLTVGIWFVLSIVTNLFFGLNARQRLLTEFREVATQRFQQGPGFFKRLFGVNHQPPPN